MALTETEFHRLTEGRPQVLWPLGVVGLLFLLLVGNAQAKENYLPDRDTPVPAGQQIPVVDFVRPRLFEDPVLSPDGTHFAALSKNGELQKSLLVCEIKTGTIKWPASNLSSFEWIDDTHLVLNVGGVIDIADPKRHLSVEDILPQSKHGLMPDTGFLWSWAPDDLPRMRSSKLLNYWALPQNGEPGFLVMLSEDGKKSLLRHETRTWVECPVDLDEITPVAVGRKPGEMIVLGPRAKGKPRAIQRMDVVTGTLGEVIYQDAHYDCLPWVSFRRGTSEINGVSVPNSAQRIVWLDDKMKQVQSLINRQFPQSLAQIVSTDIKESRFLIEVRSDRQPPIYYLLDHDKMSLGLLKNTAPWIEPARMRPMQVMTYNARDGVAIEGYLTLPAGASKEHPVALIVDLHPGPWAYRAIWGWNEEVQFLASRGYAVFQPNYRGSIGYDSRIESQGRFDFRQMVDDVTEGVHKLVKTGLIDPKRIAIQGVGFGGYLALCSSLEDPALYRCALLFGGVYDWDKAFRNRGSKNHAEEAWLELQLQKFKQSPPSPLNQGNDIKIPVFFTRNVTIHDITQEDQMDEMRNALKRNVPCVNFGDLNLYRPEDAYAELVERTAKIEEFLAKYMAQ